MASTQWGEPSWTFLINFTEIPFLDRFEAAAQAGFRGVEFLFPYDYNKEELAEKVNKFNLKTWAELRFVS